MSDISASFRIPLEFPLSEEYDREYIMRVINQLRLNFSSIDTSRETNNPMEVLDWFIS